ncbi:MAG: L-aspartate oxidase [Candidatus Krumholzibacteriota bacterium]|nr:L-aspartate oxidase [Candidatus Krumholzibacteriota bacterium]
MTIEETDILIIGSGLAGLFLAYKASSYAKVTVITKREINSSNTTKAQGGIAAVLDVNDSYDSHLRDTMTTGKGLSDLNAVKTMVHGAKDKIEDLMNIGVRFDLDKETGLLDLTREGGHSNARVIHYRDFTGFEISEKVISTVKNISSIKINEFYFAIDLIKDNKGAVKGCFVLDRRKNKIKAVRAKSTVLATGGAGKIYLYTSNPDVASGDGIAMAYMAGARLSNLEFVQFHPTCLYHPEAKSFLISEALRGEGAILKNIKGIEFMEGKDPLRELAPRDIVARAIDSEMKRSGAKFVYLDITHKSSSWLKKRFPSVHQRCAEFGINIGKDMIPVVPAAHYMVGGVKTDIKGRTNVEGLYAIGEVACSGVHGANRLASNSLLEALVMADECSKVLKDCIKDHLILSKNQLSYPVLGDAHRIQTVILDHDWDLVRRIMWDYVGIVRSDERLNIARKRVYQIRETINKIYSRYGVSVDMVELRNIVLVSSLVVYSAILRKESRGLHYNSDYPYTNPAWKKDTILEPGVI